MMDYWLFPFLASVISAGVIALRLRFGDRGLDHPNQRSLHERPTPHGGGLGIVTALLVIGLLLFSGAKSLTKGLGLPFFF